MYKNFCSEHKFVYTTELNIKKLLRFKYNYILYIILYYIFFFLFFYLACSITLVQ